MKRSQDPIHFGSSARQPSSCLRCPPSRCHSLAPTTSLPPPCCHRLIAPASLPHSPALPPLLLELPWPLLPRCHPIASLTMPLLPRCPRLAATASLSSPLAATASAALPPADLVSGVAPPMAAPLLGKSTFPHLYNSATPHVENQNSTDLDVGRRPKLKADEF